MDNQVKTLTINCRAHFQSYIGSYNKPELRMHVDELIGSDMFILTNTGRWFHHGGKELNCVSKDIEVSGSRFCYEGEIHPGAGYEPELNISKDEAKFTISGTIYNKLTKESKDVVFEFVTTGICGNKDISNYMSEIKKFEQDKLDSGKKATDIMATLNA